MGKRGAEDQLTKDDVEGGGRGRDDSDNEDLARDAPKEVLATRQIRGMPKRKAATGASAAAPTPSFGFGQSSTSTSVSSFGAPASTAAFSFGNAAATPSLSSTTPAKPAFGFGAPAGTAMSESTSGTTSTPFSGFNFGSSGAAPPSAAFATGSTPASSTTANTAKTTTSDTASVTKTPFTGFNFGGSAAPAKPNPLPTAPAAAPSTANKTSAFGAFGRSSENSFTSSFGASTTSPSAPVPTGESSGPKAVNGASEPTAAPSRADAPKEDEKEVEYLTSVRGLNESVLRALSVKVRDEPFINLASALESVKAEYATYLEEITKKAGKSMAANGMQAQTKKRDATDMDGSSDTAPPKKKTTEAVKPPVSMPAPPSMPSTGGFKLPAPSTTAAVSTGTGFKPSLPTTNADNSRAGIPAVGGFKLPTASSSNTQTTSTGAGGFKPTLPSTQSVPAKASPFAGFSFGQTAEKKDSPSPAPAGAVSSIPFPTFGATPSAAATSATDTSSGEQRPSSRASQFAQAVIDEQEKEKEAAKETPATPSASSQKQSSIFAIKPTVKAAIGDAMVVPSPPSAGGASSFLFKAPSTPSAAASTTPSKLPTFSFNMGATGSSAAPATPGTPGTPGTFSFAPKPRSSSAAFGFGGGQDTNIGKTDAPSTTPSKPIASGFSFGATAPRATPTQPLFSAPSAASGDVAKPVFSFGPTSTFGAPKQVETVADSSAANTDSEEAPADAGPQADLTVGAGEEDEETLWQGKVSVGSFGKFGDSSAPTWGDWKLCILRLNREKSPSNGAQPMRRILARIDPSGAIVQNFSLRSLSDMSVLARSAYRMTIAEADGGIKQIAIRFGKKREGFDPAPVMEKLKSAIQTERDAMALPSLPSLQ